MGIVNKNVYRNRTCNANVDVYTQMVERTFALAAPNLRVNGRNWEDVGDVEAGTLPSLLPLLSAFILTMYSHLSPFCLFSLCPTNPNPPRDTPQQPRTVHATTGRGAFGCLQPTSTPSTKASTVSSGPSRTKSCSGTAPSPGNDANAPLKPPVCSLRSSTRRAESTLKRLTNTRKSSCLRKVRRMRVSGEIIFERCSW